MRRMSHLDELDEYEADLELRLKKEYSAVFGLFRTRPAAAKMLRPLAKGGAKTLLTRTLTRAEHERRSRPVAKRP